MEPFSIVEDRWGGTARLAVWGPGGGVWEVKHTEAGLSCHQFVANFGSLSPTIREVFASLQVHRMFSSCRHYGDVCQLDVLNVHDAGITYI
jgi:hypothetical protein